MIKKIIYPGTFDPITNGHCDIISRSKDIFDVIIIAISNVSTKSCLFTIDERVDIINTLFSNDKNIQVKVFSGLLIDFASRENVHCILRGLRNSSDFEYESKMEWMNEKLCQDCYSF